MDPLEAARLDLVRQRARDLTLLAQERYAEMSSASEPTAEDLSARPARYWMTDSNGLGQSYVREMAQIGEAEGFSVLVTRTQSDPALPDPGDNVEVQPIPGQTNYPWLEDSGQVSRDGSLGIVPLDLDCDEIQNYVRAQLRRRGAEVGARVGAEVAFEGIMQGAVACRGGQQSRMAFGSATGRRMRMDLGYLERGNVLIGTAGGLYALVGRDSVGISKGVIERGFARLGLGARASDRQVREAIARDIGVAPARVFYVEQAGSFHIDMAMVPWTPGVVLLNDARAVARVVAATHPGHPRLAPYVAGAHQVARFEDIAAADLRSAGLRVVRVPGRFFSFEGKIANFFNGEGGVGQSGQPFFVTQGGPAAYRDAYLAALRASSVALPTFHFLSQASSRESLELSGGLNCRAQSLIK